METATSSTLTLSSRLQPLLEQYESLGRELFADGIWTCNGGAVVLKHLCDRAGIPARLQVGLYWWPEERLRTKYELLEGSPAADEDLDGYWRDEHHHWVVVDGADLSESLLLDPNGEIREEPRLQLFSEAVACYQADDRESKWSGIDSMTDPREVATWDKDVAHAIAVIDAAMAVEAAQ